jgi:hypothetical protein
MTYKPAAEAKGLRCFACGGGILAVKDSRPSRNAVRRRRRCLICHSNFTTFEIMSPTRDDTHRLFAALDFYEQMAALPEPHRAAVLALLKALSPPPPVTEPEEALPPLLAAMLIGAPTPAGQLSLDAALGGGEPEDAPYG